MPCRKIALVFFSDVQFRSTDINIGQLCRLLLKFYFSRENRQEKINKKTPSFSRRFNLSTCWTTTVNVDQESRVRNHRREFVPLQKRERCFYYQCTLNVKYPAWSCLVNTEVQHTYIYRKVASRSTSRLVAPPKSSRFE